MLPFDPDGLRDWIGGDELIQYEKISVQVVRLDTFLAEAGIEHVDYLKIDAQGADLSVIRSAGDRLRILPESRWRCKPRHSSSMKGPPPRRRL